MVFEWQGNETSAISYVKSSISYAVTLDTNPEKLTTDANDDTNANNDAIANEEGDYKPPAAVEVVKKK